MTTMKQRRRRHRRAVAYVRASGILDAPGVDDDVLLVYTVGALLADGGGHVTESKVVAACADPVMVDAARAVIAEAAA